jgi:hypothetical protein
MRLRPPRRSAIWTFVAPARPADFRMNTTTPTLPTSGVRHFTLAQAADQHKRQPNPRSAFKWHESGLKDVCADVSARTGLSKKALYDAAIAASRA